MAEKTLVTGDELEQEVRRLAAEYPDARYEAESASCQYLTGKAGKGEGCIFGQALRNLGVPVDVLVGFDEKDSSIKQVIDETGLISATYEQKQWFTTVQETQDLFGTWDTAVKDADSQREDSDEDV